MLTMFLPEFNPSIPLIPAIGKMAEAPQHCPVDAVLPNLQEAEIPLGPARWSPGQLQGRTRPGDHTEEAVSSGGEMLSGEAMTLFDERTIEITRSVDWKVFLYYSVIQNMNKYLVYRWIIMPRYTKPAIPIALS